MFLIALDTNLITCPDCDGQLFANAVDAEGLPTGDIYCPNCPKTIHEAFDIEEVDGLDEYDGYYPEPDDYYYGDDDYDDYDGDYGDTWTYEEFFLRRNRKGKAYIERRVIEAGHGLDSLIYSHKLSLRDVPFQHRAVAIEYAKAGQWDTELTSDFLDADEKVAQLDDAYEQELPPRPMTRKVFPGTLIADWIPF